MMMPLGEAFYRGRVRELQAFMHDEGMDGMVLSEVENIIYVSGFVHTPSERPLCLYIPAQGDPALFVPLLEQENAADTWISDVRTYFEFPDVVPPFAQMMQHIDGDKIGVDTVPVSANEMDQGALTYPDFWERVAYTDFVMQLRYIKQPEELECIRLAASYADYCLQVVRDQAAEIIRNGGTELDILAACESVTRNKMLADLGGRFSRRLLKVGGTVHSGPRAALPHGEPIERVPQRGDTLIAGIGASVGGYHAESGATFLIGEVQQDRMRCLEVAAATDQAAVNALRPGNSCNAVNEAALNVIKAAGYGDCIRHRIGHGMGLRGHEAPWLAPGDGTILQAGMVFSNEPGIYRPGNDGYRTISTMIVTEGVAEVPSRFLAENPPAARIIPA